MPKNIALINIFIVSVSYWVLVGVQLLSSIALCLVVLPVCAAGALVRVNLICLIVLRGYFFEGFL